MANKAIFSYGNNGKRKIGHSKFDMGHEHIMSSNFGGLFPAACFETLPDDYWDISDNTVTLLKPLTAPAFTRINQNFYAAYVRNQQIWKYWNDYISNGTSFGDVYGNNVTNQSLKNAWDVPSIPTSYLQFITKVGNGNAAPCFTFEERCVHAGTGPGGVLAKMIALNTTFYNVGSTYARRITDVLYLLLQVDPTNSSLRLAREFMTARQIGLSDYSFDVWMWDDGVDYHFLFSFYCSLRQWLSLCSALNISTVSNQNSQNATEIGSSQSDSYSYGGYAETRQTLRFFCDRISPEPSTASSAFILEKSDYQSESGDFLKSLDFYPRVVDSLVSKVGFVPYSAGGYTDDAFRSVYQCIQSPYWGFRYVFDCDPNSQSYFFLNCDTVLPSFDWTNDFRWSIDAYGLFGVDSDSSAQTFFESVSQNIHYLGVSQSSMQYGLDMFYSFMPNLPLSVAPDPNSQGTYDLADSFGNWFALTSSTRHFIIDSPCDIAVYFGNSDSSSQVYDWLPQRSFTSRESKSLGYDSISMLFYSCRQSSLLLDSFGLKVDPLSQRPFDNYRFELTNALPFFAYSKIWHDNFRNSVVSSPELDFSESNGVMCTTSEFYNYFVFAPNGGIFFMEPAVRPSRYANKVASDFSPNGWTLELTTFPRNSQGNLIHTHLPIREFSDVLAVLVGHNFDRLFCYTLQSTDLNVYDYYMPSYYNGLLHLKYQNFNKDYFTSALLDPMSGANQVALGSTVNELRQAEAEQHWWERTAMYRNIKSWFQGTYGITPIELPEDSRITGTDHVDVNIGEVIQTSGTTPESPQGQRTGLGGCRGSGTLCHGHANEHGWIIVLVSHTIESQYLQAFDKMWDVKESFLDYPTIDFASIGNESILQKELNYTTMPVSFFDYNYNDFSSQSGSSIQYLPTIASGKVRYRGQSNPIRKNSQTSGFFNIAQNAGTSLDNIFGFIPRYSSYKFKFDQVSGQFRHELAFWHTFKKYLTSPILCHEFVNWEMAADDEEINRIFAVADDLLDDKFNIDCFINATVDRALPFVCVPMSK